MAEAIPYDHRTRDARQELYHKLQGAPEHHIEALLDLYAILQLLHDKGILEVIKDALGSGEKVLEILTGTMERDEIVRTVRNLTIFIKLIGAIEPDALENLMTALSDKVEKSKVKKPPGLLRLLGQLSSKDSRRGLETIVGALQVAGKTMPRQKKEERTKVTRHRIFK